MTDMSQSIGEGSRRAGLAPGTLVHWGEEKTGEVRVSVISYDADEVREADTASIDDLGPPRSEGEIVWINVDGIHRTEIIEQIGRQFELHPLLLEDIADTDERAKAEDYGPYILVLMKMLRYDEAAGEVLSEQVSVVFGSSFVISFQESAGDVFDPVRQRIRNGRGRIRSAGADYLAYALIDAVADSYFIVEEKLGEQIADLEEALVARPDAQIVKRIYILRRQVMVLRRSVWPLREAIGVLQREESALIQPSTVFHLRDVYDHTIHVMDTIENFRELLAGMLDVHLSSVSNRMNEVMKVLTIIATIFMPLTFLAGVYGMNFRYMPELASPWGYPAVMGIMALIGIGMLAYFRRKRWL
jgi:magnesium transporter